MYFVYFLRSLKNGDLYVGSTEDVHRRIGLHNAGRVKSTKAYKPWELLNFRAYTSRSEAVKAEMFYKAGQQKEILKEKYGHVVK